LLLRSLPERTARLLLAPVLRESLRPLAERIDFKARPTDRAVEALLAARPTRDDPALVDLVFVDRSFDFLTLERVDERSVRSVFPLLVLPR
jgi:hypothetical protein